MSYLVTPRTPHASSRVSVPRWTATAVCLAMITALGLVAGGVQSAASAAPQSASRAVAHTDQGKMVSTIKGKTANGQAVAGTFTPLHVARKHGDLMVKGILQGVVHEASGKTSTFSGIRSLPVKKINGQSLTRDAAKSAVSDRAACNILHLVLGPLDLNLLGLTVHLNQVVLDITAVPGAGNLLGNLLCAVAGLLDGTPIGGLLGQIAGLLNQILAALNLGI
ncbi:MAG TPA: hypothetical protein VFI19_01970 [Nocardioides sp.]|nr:hypothetical protein [Nocardioides sp.]